MKQIFTNKKKKKHLMKKSTFQQYFHCFVVGMLVPYAFWFSYQQNIVTILITAAFRCAALIRGEAKGGYPKVQRLFEALRLLEEIRYQTTT